MPVTPSEEQSHMYCSEQINIPATFPGILKCYAKAAIRTQPSDLLYWTAAYFRALADGELPPVKKRLEYPPYDNPTGISPGFLKALLNQFAGDEENGEAAGTTKRTATSMCVTLGSLLARWRGMALPDSSLWQVLMTGRLLELPGAPGECDLYRFLAIACGLLGNTMIHVCELLTDEPEGGSAMIPRKTFMNLYEYLADLDCSGGQSIIGTGPADVVTTPERDEASLVRSNSVSSSSSSSFGSGISTGHSSVGRKTQVVLCQGIDTSIEETDSEESICRTEVSSRNEYRKRLGSGRDGGTEVQRRETRDSEEGASGRASFRRRRSDSTGNGTSAKATGETKLPRNERSTNDDKKRSERRVPEGKADEPDGSGAEVTRVQEVRRRRLDVEMHSRTEEVKPVAGETAAELPSTLLDSSRSRVALSSSPGKSHVVAGEGVKAPGDDDGETATDATRENTKLQRHEKFERADKILATRSLQLREEVEGGRHAERQRAVSGIGVGDAAVGPTIARRNGVKKIRRKIPGQSKKPVEGKLEGANEEDIPRDSFEYEDPTDNGEKVERKRMPGSKPVKESSEQERVAERETDFGDYVNDGSYDGNGSEGGYEDVDDEEVEDMAKYETIGLENVLEGICECLDSTRETRGGSSVAAGSASPPLDPVLEFVERMRAEDPTGPYVQPEVPGIGPPVSNERVTAVGLWLAECSRRQQGYVGPRNLRHFLCPNLDEKPCHDYHGGSDTTRSGT